MVESQVDSGEGEAVEPTGYPLMGRTVRERWDIPEALRRPLIQRLGEIARDPNAANREVLAAAGALLAASKINLANIAMTMKVREHEELEERVTKIEQRFAERYPKGMKPGRS